MFGWLKKPAPPPREALLAARIVRNELVKAAPQTDGGGVRLKAPIRRAGWWRRTGTAGGATPTKTFQLDELGAFVWEGIDGRRTVEEAIRRFATEKRVNLREAEVAVLAFLKTLTQRGLVAMVVPKAVEETVPRGRRKKRKRV